MAVETKIVPVVGPVSHHDGSGMLLWNHDVMVLVITDGWRLALVMAGIAIENRTDRP